MLKIIILLLIAGAAIFAGPYLSDTQGLVHIVAGDWEINTSITTAAILILAAFLVLYVVVSLVLKILRFPGLTKRFFKRRGQRKAVSLSSKAVLAFERGEYQTALSIVKQLRAQHQVTAEALFSGARSAFAMGSYSLTSELLDEAQKMGAGARVAASVIRARLNLRLSNAQAAMEIINDIKSEASSKLITELNYECCRHEHDLKGLNNLLPQLLRHKIISTEQARSIGLAYIKESLEKSKTASEVSSLYSSLNKQHRKDPAILAAIVNKMVALGDINHARKICLGLLKHHPEAEVLESIASFEISIPDVLKLLKSQASGNLIASQVNVPLLKAIANMELHEGQLKEAQEHYEKAFELNQSQDICLKLAGIMSAQRFYDKAAMYYEKALKLNPQKELPAPKA